MARTVEQLLSAHIAQLTLLNAHLTAQLETERDRSAQMVAELAALKAPKPEGGA